MSNPERHHMTYDVIEDILTLLSSRKDESAINFRNILFVTYGITIKDVERSRVEMKKLTDVVRSQLY